MPSASTIDSRNGIGSATASPDSVTFSMKYIASSSATAGDDVVEHAGSGESRHVHSEEPAETSVGFLDDAVTATTSTSARNDSITSVPAAIPEIIGQRLCRLDFKPCHEYVYAGRRGRPRCSTPGSRHRMPEGMHQPDTRCHDHRTHGTGGGSPHGRYGMLDTFSSPTTVRTSPLGSYVATG